MREAVCPSCGGVIPVQDLNVAADVALCRKCNSAQPLSQLVSGNAPDPRIDPHRAPHGCWYRPSAHGAVTGASRRSLAAAGATLFFALFWNGIVSVFVLLATAATFRLMEVPVPDWLPAPDTGENGMPKGAVIFLWIFLLPFLFVGLVLINAFFSSLFGKAELSVDRGSARISSGIAPFAKATTFLASDFSSLRIEDHVRPQRAGNGFGQRRIVVDLVDGRSIPFGVGVPRDRLRFLASISDRLLRGTLP